MAREMLNDKKPIRALVIGTGHIGQQHLLALRKVPNCTVAVCDRSPTMAELSADRHSAAAWYADAAKAFADFRPDVAHICTPASSHLPLGRLALEMGAHAIIEKPITENHADWICLREAAERAGLWLMEDHNYAFNPPVLHVRNLIDSGEFGDVVHVDIQFALNIHEPTGVFSDPHLPHPALQSPGGVIADFLPHLSYLAIAFVGAATTVRTVWHKRANNSLFQHDEMRALVVGQTGTASLLFSSHIQPDLFRLVVHGTRMTASISLFENICHIDKSQNGPGTGTALLNSLAAGKNYTLGGLRSIVAKLSSVPVSYSGLHTLVQSFYQSLREGHACPVTLTQIAEAIRLVDALIDKENRT